MSRLDKRRGRSSRHDIVATSLPPITADEWRTPDEVLAKLYQGAEARALGMADWYLRDRRWKRRASQILRALAILLTTAGGLQPLIASDGSGTGGLRWGYVLLAAAGACVAFDRYFGLSSRWMRDVVAAQHLQRRIHTFQYEWIVLCAETAVTTPETAVKHLELLKSFAVDLSDIVAAETSQWVTEFASGVDQLKDQAGQHQP